MSGITEQTLPCGSLPIIPWKPDNYLLVGCDENYRTQEAEPWNDCCSTGTKYTYLSGEGLMVRGNSRKEVEELWKDEFRKQVDTLKKRCEEIVKYSYQDAPEHIEHGGVYVMSQWYTLVGIERSG